MMWLGKRKIFFLVVCLLGVILGQAFTGFGQDAFVRRPVPEGVYIDLTRDFYHSLREEGGANSKNYSNDLSLVYLKEISISARYMVETNLQILKNQEIIMQMLESGRRK